MKNSGITKRIGFSLLFLTLFTFSLVAQDESVATKKIQYGIKFGTTLSRFSSEQPHNNIKVGLSAGAFVSYPLSASLDLRLEPAYMQQGGKLISVFDYGLFLMNDAPYALEVRDNKITYNNVEIPLLIRYKKSIGGLNVFAVVGPSIGLNFKTITKTNISARSWESVPVYVNFYREEDITSNIEMLQYGAVGGIGFETPVGTHNLIFDIRYRYGLNKTYPGYSYLGIYQIQGDLKSNSVELSLGFSF